MDYNKTKYKELADVIRQFYDTDELANLIENIEPCQRIATIEELKDYLERIIDELSL